MHAKLEIIIIDNWIWWTPRRTLSQPGTPYAWKHRWIFSGNINKNRCMWRCKLAPNASSATATGARIVTKSNEHTRSSSPRSFFFRVRCLFFAQWNLFTYKSEHNMLLSGMRRYAGSGMQKNVWDTPRSEKEMKKVCPTLYYYQLLMCRAIFNARKWVVRASNNCLQLTYTLSAVFAVLLCFSW